MTHLLKSWPGEFEAVQERRKRHEIRHCRDRVFAEGDLVILQEWNPAVYEEALKNSTEKNAEVAKAKASKAACTGRQVLRTIAYVSIAGSWGLPPDLCVFSMKGNNL